MSEPEEGMDFLAGFKGKFGSLDSTRERLKAERKAGLTPKQRAKKAPPKKQVNFRATAETRAVIKAMSAHLGTDDTAVITQAIHALAESLGLGTKK